MKQKKFDENWRFCCNCDAYKPWSEYAVDKQKLTWHQSQCKTCKNEYTREYKRREKLEEELNFWQYRKKWEQKWIKSDKELNIEWENLKRMNMMENTFCYASLL